MTKYARDGGMKIDRQDGKQMLVLASGSPRRKELLEQVGVKFEIHKAVGEEVITSSNPEEVVKELSNQKAKEVANRLLKVHKNRSMVILGADTVVSIQDEILGKPVDKEDAYRMIHSLQGEFHEVVTGVTLLGYENGIERFCENFAVTTKVEVYPMKDEEIWDYIRTKEPMDKAGAYGIQGYFAAYIKGIVGDYNNVVGLPLGEVCQRLKAHGIMK